MSVFTLKYQLGETEKTITFEADDHEKAMLKTVMHLEGIGLVSLENGGNLQ